MYSIKLSVLSSSKYVNGSSMTIAFHGVIPDSFANSLIVVSGVHLV